jgi:hypothetical protein
MLRMKLVPAEDARCSASNFHKRTVELPGAMCRILSRDEAAGNEDDFECSCAGCVGSRGDGN